MLPSSPPERRLTLLQGGRRSSTSQPLHDEWADLARAASRGDPRAVRTFLVNVGPYILRVVRRVLGNGHGDVEDLTQESAFAVIDALPSFRGECSALHFVCRIAVLTTMNARRRLRTAKRARELEPGDALDNVACLRPGPEQNFVARASAQLVRELLGTLPIEQAEALALHCVLGYTLTEMADSSGVSCETWKSRLRLAKRAFRQRALADLRAYELIAPFGDDRP
jgi:RNA polymerase sigma factor (sigma-70 family)